MLPRVILHNAVSIDGRIDWFTPNIGLFYELAMRWGEDATLAGSETMLNSPDDIPEEDETAFEPPKIDPEDKRPLLIIPDSKGRIRSWHYWRKQPYWRDIVALCSKSTPKDYIEYLEKRHINFITTGEDHIDLRAALEKLNTRYGIKTVRVDSGGTLNGVLLREGLVDKVSVLIHPTLVGGTAPRSIFRADDLTSGDDVIKLELTGVEKLKDNVVWLRYEVVK